MTFQPAPACAEIVMNFDCGGKALANVMNVWFPTGYVQADLDAVASFVDGAIHSDYKPVVHTGVFYDNTTVRGLNAIIDLISIDATHAGNCTDAGNPMPNNVTMCFRLKTGFTGRSARGRFYAMPTVQAELAVPNQFTTTYATNVEIFLNQILTGLPGLGANLIILSRWSAGVRRPSATHKLVTTIDHRNREVDSQRGRLLAGH